MAQTPLDVSEKVLGAIGCHVAPEVAGKTVLGGIVNRYGRMCFYIQLEVPH